MFQSVTYREDVICLNCHRSFSGLKFVLPFSPKTSKVRKTTLSPPGSVYTLAVETGGRKSASFKKKNEKKKKRKQKETGNSVRKEKVRLRMSVRVRKGGVLVL